MAAESAIIPQLAESITPSSPAATCSGPMAGGDTSSNAHTSIPCQQDIVLDEQTKRELFTDTFCKVCNAVLQFESHRISHYEGKKHAQKVRLYFLKNELEEMALKTQRTDRVEFHVDGEVAQGKHKFCGLCNMVFSSPVVAQTHYVGKVHAKKMRQLAGEQVEWTPQTDQDFAAAAATSPVDSQTEIADSPAVEPTCDRRCEQEGSAEQQSCPDYEIDLNDPNKYCKLCCASFNKALVAQQHYSGKKHARNQARKKMMEEMEGTGVADSEVSDGRYVCPICNITLTSIEMYQSHMQGNKHQIKESMVANLMKTSKKNYDSFQDELADYIKVQKARGLVPKTQFRQEKDQYDSCDYEEEEEQEPEPGLLHGHINSKTNAPYKYLDRHPVPYPAHNPSHPTDQRVPPWAAHWEQASRPPKGHHLDLHKAKHISRSPTSQDSSDNSSGSSSDESSGSYKKDKRRKRKHHRESRLRGSGRIRRGDENSEKRKRKGEDADSGKEDNKHDRGKTSGGDKDKHRREKKKKEEQSKKHKKLKKEGEQRTEEEMLWDESILGF
ncbi:hypothetical protein XENTR_v10000252 [Xenopus tropicalis]|uniref:Zinc finger matrin-type protein 1 n=1 Tax=Xenopus tropicalis TaxID=8364 RepID=ZMAT1_XENTR|nr:zinc finger matrin-type protein 1 [Xenopus tropicalis]Q28EG9.1 RecName: Full=Zinc finger matrin-type protein 1 [Xenopus tropicalis]KAE8628850.1 hypothetical protein XENTR_v10000252 [Xenopus tropicalis]CAJ83165.1 novel zinc finger, matrin type (zmat) family protein [Xenopus tropicalis]|eukprot:NP_001039040.1 zinc finger matrin-type protein 1 [Xenopus tropicalis]